MFIENYYHILIKPHRGDMFIHDEYRFAGAFIKNIIFLICAICGKKIKTPSQIPTHIGVHYKMALS